MKKSILSLAAALSVANAGPAFKFPVERRSDAAGLRISASTGSLPTYAVGGDSTGGIANIGDLSYTTTITVCGQKITVLIDTGSTDLWVKPPIPLSGVENTKLSTKIVYGSGDVAGPIALCPVTLGAYTVAKQAFISVSSGNVDNLFSQKIYGIIGLGFDSLSKVNSAVTKSDKNAIWGRSLLTNLFYANPATPNYIAFMLDRASDLDEVAEGSFTVGETETKYSSVINQPALPVFPDADVSRWNVVLDAVTVNGTAVSLQSSVKGAPSGKTIALLDTGTSLIYGPKAAVDAIYGAIPGSYYYKAEQFWAIPCLSSVDIAFNFAGANHPIHPLDLTIVSQIVLPDGTIGSICAAAIRENTIAVGSGELDWLMGDTFLRNVYSVFDFGDLDTSTGGLVGHPFVKLLPLPTSDPKTAASDFSVSRSFALSRLPPPLTPVALASLPDTSSSNPSSSAPTSEDNILKVVLPIVLGVVGVILLIVGCIFFFKRRGKKVYQPVKTYGH